MSTLAIETITGRIAHVGQYTYDKVTHTYSLVELDTATGRVDLASVVAPNAVDRAIVPGHHVSMAILRMKGRKPTVAVLGVFDHATQRTFSDEQMPASRSIALKQATVLTLTAVVWLPVAFLLYVVPGFVGLWVLWKSWAAVGRMPSAEQVRNAIAGLAAKGKSTEFPAPAL